MSVKLSPQKAARVLRGYFRGLSQTQIAESAGVDQSTVSLYSTRFRRRVAEIGLSEAGEEFNVIDAVEALRSLATELARAKLTVEEAREGYRVLLAFVKLGARPVQHEVLARICREIGDPGFVHAVVKLGEIESETGLTYGEALDQLERASLQLPSLEGKLAATEGQLGQVESTLTQRTQELADLESSIVRRRGESTTQQVRLQKDLEAKMKNAKVSARDVEDTARLKVQLARQGLDLATALALVKEMGDGEK